MRNFRLGEWLPEAMTPLFAELWPRGRHSGNRLSMAQRVDYLLGGLQWLNDLVQLGFNGGAAGDRGAAGHHRPAGVAAAAGRGRAAAGHAAHIGTGAGAVALRRSTGIGSRRALLAFANWLSLSWTVAMACIQAPARCRPGPPGPWPRHRPAASSARRRGRVMGMADQADHPGAGRRDRPRDGEMAQHPVRQRDTVGSGQPVAHQIEVDPPEPEAHPQRQHPGDDRRGVTLGHRQAVHDPDHDLTPTNYAKTWTTHHPALS